MGILTHPMKGIVDELSKVWVTLRTIGETLENINKVEDDLISANKNLLQAISLQQKVIEEHRRFIQEELYKLRSDILDLKKPQAPATPQMASPIDAMSVIKEALKQEKELQKLTNFDM